MKTIKTVCVVLFSIFSIHNASANTSIFKETEVWNYTKFIEFLDEKEKLTNELFKFCCRYSETEIFPKSSNGLIEFEAKEAWYIYTKIDNFLLFMKNTENELCKKGVFSERPCEEKEIELKYNKNALDYSSVIGWYGKFTNRFLAYESDGQFIYPTARLTGYNFLYFSRSNKTDEVVLGPFYRKPSKLVLKYWSQSSSSNVIISN